MGGGKIHVHEQEISYPVGHMFAFFLRKFWCQQKITVFLNVVKGVLQHVLAAACPAAYYDQAGRLDQALESWKLAKWKESFKEAHGGAEPNEAEVECWRKSELEVEEQDDEFERWKANYRRVSGGVEPGADEVEIWRKQQEATQSKAGCYS